MHTVEINNTIMDMTLVTEEELRANDPKVLQLEQFLQDWQGIGLINEINLTQDAGDPNLYSYIVSRLDTTEFVQTLRFDDLEDLDPLVTASLPSPWRLSVLSFEGPIREQLIQIRSCCDVLSFEAEFH